MSVDDYILKNETKLIILAIKKSIWIWHLFEE